MMLLLVAGIFTFFRYKQQREKVKSIQKNALLKLQATEISERKKTETAIRKYAKKLENKNKELEQFTYIASHDLQEPLNSIISLTEILTDEHTNEFDDEGKNIVFFLNKAQVGKLPIVFAHKMELQLLFESLMDNALKFRKKEGFLLLKISCEKTEEDGWRFCVADNGIGLDMRFKDRIFTIFRQLNSKEEYAGVGIGLSFCKKIVDLYNGEIYVESELGKGSKFYFTINLETL